MKREFLEKLGLSKAAIDAVMSEHGKTIEEHRLRAEALEQEIAVLNPLTEENQGLKAALTDKNEAISSLLDRMVTLVLDGITPSSALAANALTCRLREALEQGEDPKALLRKLREEDPDAFAKTGTVLPVFSAVHFASEEDFPSLSAAMRRR